MPQVSFQFQPLQDSHLELLHKWLNEDHVAERWDGPSSIEEVGAKYFSGDKGENEARYIAYLDGKPIGYVQSYWATRSGDGWWQDEKDPGTVGIDFFIGCADRLNQGIGTRMIKEFLQTLFADPTVTKIISDPAPDNPRSL